MLNNDQKPELRTIKYNCHNETCNSKITQLSKIDDSQMFVHNQGFTWLPVYKQFLFAGGKDSTKNTTGVLNNTFLYSVEKVQPIPLKPLNMARKQFTMCFIPRKDICMVLAVGGCSGENSSTYQAQCETLDVSEKTWSLNACLVKKRLNPFLVPLNHSHVLVIGGSSNEDNDTKPIHVKEIEIINVDNNISYQPQSQLHLNPDTFCNVYAAY